MMALFSSLQQACIDLIKVLPELNDNQRKEMREILLQLKSDLSDALIIAEQYFRSIQRTSEESEMLNQMYDAPSQLINTFNELKICSSLMHLHDRFNQWFNKVKASVNTKHLDKIEKLLAQIADRERFVVENLEDIIRELPPIADKIREAASEDKKDEILNAKKGITHAIAPLKEAEQEIKQDINAVLTLM